MKWVFVVGFLLATALLVIAKTTAPKEKNDDVVAHLIWATDDNPARKEQMQLFREWHLKHYGEKIDISTSVLNYDASKIVIQSLAGSGPDVFDYGASAQLERYVRSGIILDVTDIAKEKGFSTEIIWPGIRPSVEFEGRQYAFPDNAVNSQIFYHKDLFDEAGIPYPKNGWTWDEFIATAKKLTYKKSNTDKQYGILTLNPMIPLKQYGAQFFTPAGTRCIINSPEALRGLQNFYNLSAKHKVMPTGQELSTLTSQGGWGGNINMFAAKNKSNRFAMMEGGRYLLIALTKDVREMVAKGEKSPLNLGIVDFPRGTFRYGTGLARATGVNKNGKQVKYAVRFLEFLASESYNRQINRSYDALAPVIQYCTGPQGIADGPPPPPGLECANDPEWADAMMNAYELDASPFISPYRLTVIWGEETTLMDLRKQTPAQTLEKLQNRINEDIQRNISRDEKLRQQYEEALQKDGEVSK